MIGITAFGAYVPYFRLQRKTIGEALESGGGVGEKAVAGYDEDSVSLAATAAIDCIIGVDPKTVDALYFATTTAPYKEKQSATTIAAALDLRKEVRTADFAGSLRAGSTAVLSALDAIKGGTMSSVLVAMADCRLGAASSQNETETGDGAAALLLGSEQVVAEIEATNSVAQEMLAYWRTEDHVFTNSSEDRFVDTVYQQAVVETVKGIMDKMGYTPADFSKLVLYSPKAKLVASTAKKLGFNGEQVADTLTETIGNAGVANAVMMLVAVLEKAEPGERIMMVTFGEGCDAIILKTTEALAQLPPRKGISGYARVKNNSLQYEKYLRWKGLLTFEPPRRTETPRPSIPALYRGYHQNLSFYGSKCNECGTPQFPKQRICVKCQAKDRMEDYRFANEQARVTTYSVDNLAVSPSPPTIVAVVDFTGGGRMFMELTDCEPSEVHIGMDVQPSFRRLYLAGGVYNYFWKAVPKR